MGSYVEWLDGEPERQAAKERELNNLRKRNEKLEAVARTGEAYRRAFSTLHRTRTGEFRQNKESVEATRAAFFAALSKVDDKA